MHKILFYNAKLILKDKITRGAVAIVDNTIACVIETESINLVEFSDYDHEDLAGKYIAPGFIDIHVHGGGGFDFMDGTIEAFQTIASTHAKYGTTAMVPTTLTTTTERLIATLQAFNQIVDQSYTGARLLGMHLEGPYFAKTQRGAQDPRYIRDPNPDEYIPLLQQYKSIVRWSLAPELSGALEMGKYLESIGVLSAIAHTDAVYEDVIDAHKVGFRLMTHFYSAMSGVSRKNAFRYAGVIEAGYLIDDFHVEIIADGIHLPAPLLQLIYKVKGKDKMILITDAMRATGTTVDTSILGSKEDGLEVLIEDGVAKLIDRSAFAGSIATTNRLVKTMLNLTDIPLVEIIQMLTLNPAKMMNVDDRFGTLESGKLADLVVFDDNIEIHKTIINGHIVYSK